jgi:hypothetical protein
MGKELIEKIKGELAAMKRIEATGFADQQKAAGLFRLPSLFCFLLFSLPIPSGCCSVRSRRALNPCRIVHN